MKILSIDIGIKNLSFCLFDVDKNNDSFIISKWDNIDLSETQKYFCIEIDKKGICNKPAKFIKDNNICYCLKHSKTQNLQSELKPSYLNKQNIQTLIELANKHQIKFDNPPKKQKLISLLKELSNENTIQPIIKNNASKINLVTIGKNIQYNFDIILEEHIKTLDTIIIENQIGPIANKMKTIQGMISQYFIMKNNNINIEFISASNKLKDYLKTNNITNKLDYKQRKKLSIEYCNNYITNKDSLEEWLAFFIKHSKKDDLADCFLQGLWYINNKL